MPRFQSNTLFKSCQFPSSSLHIYGLVHNPCSLTIPPSSLNITCCSSFAQAENHFISLIGTNAIEDLHNSVNSHTPVITIAADQSTGKSTLAKKLHQQFGGKLSSAGQFFREKAKSVNISVAELSRRAHSSPEIDVGIDYELSHSIGIGCSSGVYVVEGRQPAIWAKYMQSSHNKQSVIKIFLKCSKREQALRYIERELDQSTCTLARSHLPNRDYLTLSEVGQQLLKIAGIDNIESVIRTFQDNERRDDDDRARYFQLYGDDPALDYRNLDNYDIVIDTTHNTPDDTYQQCIAAIKQFQQSQLNNGKQTSAIQKSPTISKL